MPRPIPILAEKVSPDDAELPEVARAVDAELVVGDEIGMDERRWGLR